MSVVARKSLNKLLSFLGPTERLRELDIEDDVHVSTAHVAGLRSNVCVIVEAHTLASELLHRARGWDLVECNEESAAVESGQPDRAAL